MYIESYSNKDVHYLNLSGKCTVRPDLVLTLVSAEVLLVASSQAGGPVFCDDVCC